ncbi:NTP transferase domain-containing protein [Prevotella sp. E13-17]|uniref:mannose-1-phosphate guanylyltransferase n=1 Tax=Prevotella sp. E13-17 TaxID=2913616 RepID=UPI001EDB466C|nr:sugar phosphate nucleotidyltransferase [Prevotella sp. E13-17]UKK51163.1 NTP transferase domain-containing protein [Prevotella sp. E13-17]
MKKNSHNYCVILAGGRGKRLWPTSRTEHPKQFIDFFGTGKTLLQATFDRMAALLPKENIFVCTCREYDKLVHEQLCDLDDDHILYEPVNRNTAPAVAWAGVMIHRCCQDARIVVIPADQMIFNEEAFGKDITDGLDFAAGKDFILTMGIKPSRPEPGYGYIQMGDHTLKDNIYKVQSFTEKPEREFAQMFMDSGEFLWNTGIYITDVNHLRNFFIEVIKDVPYRIANLLDMGSKEECDAYVSQHYPAYPNISMDKAALEMSEDVYVMHCGFGWADIGTWHALYECMQKNDDDNVVIDSEVILEECKDNIIKLPKGHIGIINGLEGYIVAEQDDVLLICKKSDSSSLIRKYVNEVGIRYGEKYV